MKRVASIYREVLWTYLRWAPSLVLLAVIVFAPLGLIHSLTVGIDVDALNFEGSLQIFATVLAASLLAITGLLGEVFYTGAVAISLTHPHDGRPPTLRQIARMIAYRRLIAVDLIYGAVVTIGLLLLVAPGAAAFVFFGLAAPVVEIEKRGVRDAFVRSFRLVRGCFWTVAAVLIPIELASDAITRLASGIAHNLLGESFWAEWLADFLANIAFTPFYAVAAVLITVKLIREKGEDIELHSKPVRT